MGITEVILNETHQVVERSSGWVTTQVIRC